MYTLVLSKLSEFFFVTSNVVKGQSIVSFPPGIVPEAEFAQPLPTRQTDVEFVVCELITVCDLLSRIIYYDLLHVGVLFTHTIEFLMHRRG